MRRVSLLGVPFYTLSSFRGMGIAVSALRNLGLPKMLSQKSHSFRDLGDAALSGPTTDSGPMNLRNYNAFFEDTRKTTDLARGVKSDEFVICVGGECTLIVGTMAAYKTKFKGTPGIVWLDAHGDFNTPETTPSGFIGGMCLAFACGMGPKLPRETESDRPLVSLENVVHVGSRTFDPLEKLAIERSGMKLYPASAISRVGPLEVARQTAGYLADRSDWILCHLDVDVLDPAIMPAVNFPENGGLRFEEVTVIVDELERTKKLMVFDLAAYNSEKDHRNQCGQKLVDWLSSTLFLT
jgi:arginase